MKSAGLSISGIEMRINLPGKIRTDTFHLGKLIRSCQPDLLEAAEMFEQPFLPLFPDARYLVKLRMKS